MADATHLVAHLAEVLSPLGVVKARRMFGGTGVYLGSTMIALIADDQLYFRGPSPSVPPMADPATRPFRYRRGDRTVAMRYWLAPEHLFDDEAAMRAWAKAAVATAKGPEPGDTFGHKAAARGGRSRPSRTGIKR